MSQQVKVLLDENEMPKQWYNIQADLPHPVPGRVEGWRGTP
jgi:tryptophan synthase beta chain